MIHVIDINNTHLSICAIHVTSFYFIEASIQPVQFLCLMVDGQTIRGVDVS